MNKFKNILIAYFFTLVFLVAVEALAFASSFSSYEVDFKNDDYLGFFYKILIACLIFLGVFVLLGFWGYRRNNIFLQSLCKGMLTWIYACVMPAAVVMIAINKGLEIGQLFALFQLFLGGYLIYYYKLNKALFILAFILPGISNLYFLVYGMYNKQKTDVATGQVII